MNRVLQITLGTIAAFCVVCGAVLMSVGYIGL